MVISGAQWRLVTIGWEMSEEPRLSWQGRCRSHLDQAFTLVWGISVQSHRRGLAVAGYHLTPCPEESRSGLATPLKLLELLCKPSALSSLAPQVPCLD